MKTIAITIDSLGNVKAETRGFSGGSCKTASQFIKSALGKVTSEKRTAEFSKAAETANRIPFKH